MTKQNTSQVGIRDVIKQTLTTQRFGVLASRRDKFPYPTLVAFSVSPDLSEILFTTQKESRKYENLQNDPHVSFLVDNRRNSSEDLADAVVVTGFGRVKKCSEFSASPVELREIFLEKHPELQKFVNSPSTHSVIVKISTYQVISKFLNVQELDLEQEGD